MKTTTTATTTGDTITTCVDCGLRIRNGIASPTWEVVVGGAQHCGGREGTQGHRTAEEAELADLLAGSDDEPAAPATVTMTREALVDLLTTAATIGRNSVDCSTRGDFTERLAQYGYGVGSPKLDEAIKAAEEYATAMRTATS